MNKNFRFKNNELNEKEVELVIGFQANNKDYIIYSDETLEEKENIDSKQEIKKIFIAQMLMLENKIDLKGLYEEEYKLLASKVMNVIALNCDATEKELYDALDDIEIEDFTIINVEEKLDNKEIVEDNTFEPRKIQAPLYYLKGMQNVYDKIINIMPEVEETNEIPKEQTIDNIIDFQEQLETIVKENKQRKEEDSVIIEKILSEALKKVKEIQDNNELDVDKIEKITTSNAQKSQQIIDAFAKEIQDIKNRANLLVEEYKKKKREIVELNNTISLRDESINQLHINLSNEIKTKDQQSRTIEILDKQVKELSHLIEEQNKEILSLKEEKLEQKKVIEIFKNNESNNVVEQTNKSTSQLNEIKEELNKKNEEIENLKKQIELVTLDKEAHEQASISLTQLITSKNAEARDLYDRIKELEISNSQNIANIDQGKQYIKAA